MLCSIMHIVENTDGDLFNLFYYFVLALASNDALILSDINISPEEQLS